MLYNIHTLEWDEELLRMLDVPRSMLPEVVASSGCCATTTGLFNGIAIAGIAGDQQAALFGQMCTSPGMAKCTFGTGAFMLLHTGTQPMASKNRLLTTIAWKIGDTVEYALEGSMLMAGAVVQWLRDDLQIIRSSAEVETLAASVNSSDGVVLVPAFAGLGAPHWDPYARGALRSMESERSFLLEHIGKYFGRRPKAEEVLSVWSGLRPLVKKGRRRDLEAIADHTILVSKSGLVTVTGGKWTTYRRMGQDTIDQAVEVAGLANVASRTLELKLHGWTDQVAGMAESDQVDGADLPLLQRLSADDPSLDKLLHPRLPYRVREVVWAAT